MQHADATIPAEYNDADYFREVLQLDEAQTEAFLNDELTRQAEVLGITIRTSLTPTQHAHDSMCESAVTVVSHQRTASTGSQGSNSTGMTSTSSNEHSDDFTPVQTRKRSTARSSLSFSEYEKYLAQVEKQYVSKLGSVPAPMAAEPAPSLFSVSTRKSYQSFRNGFKNRFRVRRKTATSRDDPK